MASSWASIAAEGVSFRALERKCRACMSQLEWVEVGCDRQFWRNSTVSEIRVDIVVVYTT